MENQSIILLDTSVLIDYFRKKKRHSLLSFLKNMIHLPFQLSQSLKSTLAAMICKRNFGIVFLKTF